MRRARRRAVDGTVRNSHALQQAEQRLRLALEAGHMGTWEYDVASDRLHWSVELAATLGPAGKPLNSSLAEGLARVHADDRSKVERAFRETLEHDREFHVEARLICGTGRRERWLLLKACANRDPRGRPRSITGVAMDITTRKEAEAVRHRLAKGERLRALGQMASGIAHDLNQSLALITGYSDMARQELSLDEPDLARVREMIEITARAAVEGGEALRGLLSFVRTQEMLSEVERIDVGQMLHDVARLTAPRWRDGPQAEGRPIEVIVDTAPGCAIDGSPAALREAITNLIFNSVDALPHGGAIHLVSREQDDLVVVEVHDTGMGMPPDVQSRIFDPFFTTKGERGTGLGLPQVLTIVERHSGAIELESEPQRGTTFHLKFPRVTHGRRRKGPPAEKPEPPAVRGIRILVVEDEQQLARMAGLVLTQRGHHVAAAASAEEALECLEHKSFDLVISDLGLGPGKNGWDLARVVRERWASTQFVLVTGWGAAIDAVEARARGVDRVIAKPYRISDLRQVADHVAGKLGRG
jgi:PAS domain S-box-containing protein